VVRLRRAGQAGRLTPLWRWRTSNADRAAEAHFLWRARLRDADDEMVLEAAVNGRADAIVTFNTRDYRPAVGQFGLELLTPGDALTRL
jgi:PIN domain